MRKAVFSTLAIFSACFIGTAKAAETVDQSQPVVDESLGFLAIGGDVNQKLAQTFTVGLSGDLVALNLPIVGCSENLILEIRRTGPGGTPDGVLFSTTVIAPADVPSSYTGLTEFRLDTPVHFFAGNHAAYTLRMESDAPTANCSYADSPAGELYSGGGYFFDARPNPPGWLSNKEFVADNQDLAFETIVDTDGSVPGGGADLCLATPGIGIPRWAPICRCLEDPGLREFRCALLHPDFFAIRRIPWPLPSAATYTERWTFTPLTQIKTPVQLLRSSEQLDKPLSHTFKPKGIESFSETKFQIPLAKAPDGFDGEAKFIYGDETIVMQMTLPEGLKKE